ncbi:MAG: T9SS type A sorting domain-containing protein, partial [Candidatus Cloacimonetes bacterium]|nr:T9SS type A sorting domain-containing protein [Candidatus Cloacimonadota bacterium]
PIGRYSGFSIIDISNPVNSALISNFADSATTKTVKTIDNITCVADDEGLKVFDTSNPASPQLINSLDFADEVVDFVIADSLLYLATLHEMLILNISDLLNIEPYGTFQSFSEFNSITYSESTVYLTSYGNGLFIIDVSNPQSPQQLSNYTQVGNPTDVVVSGNTAYLTCAAGWGLYIINVWNPQSPQLTSFQSIPGYPYNVARRGLVCFVATGYHGINIVDVSDPANCTLGGNILNRPSSLIRVCYVKQNNLYVADNAWNEISIYDISEPLQPILITTYEWNLPTYGMDIVDDMLFTVNGINGVSILQLDTITPSNEEVFENQPQLFISNYPNPFNPETTISYTLPTNQNVSLKIYNLRGQLVRELVKERQAEGSQSIIWDGKDEKGKVVASGLYLSRISTDNKQETHKMLLLK